MNLPPIHLDNAATSFPKPRTVGQDMADFLAGQAANPGRAGTDGARATAALVDGVRARLDRFFNNPAADPDRCIFTANATDALNLALRGICRPGDHVVTTVTEHNSVLRPLHALDRELGLTVSYARCDGAGRVDPDEVAHLLRPDTRLLVINHASNVCGTIQPVAALAAAAHACGALVLVDAAQSAGSTVVDMTALGADLLAFTGHKGLLGPTGTGGLLVGPDVPIRPTRWGGTGVRSAAIEQPDDFPYRLEAGTLNTIGLVGLAAGLDWLAARGLPDLLLHERDLADRFLAGCRDLAGIEVVGYTTPPTALGRDRTAVVSVTVAGSDPHVVGEFLDVDWNIGVRTGLHCAPRMHEALGTAAHGTVRFSFGAFNRADDVERALSGLAAVTKRG